MNVVSGSHSPSRSCSGAWMRRAASSAARFTCHSGDSRRTPACPPTGAGSGSPPRPRRNEAAAGDVALDVLRRRGTWRTSGSGSRPVLPGLLLGLALREPGDPDDLVHAARSSRQADGQIRPRRDAASCPSAHGLCAFGPSYGSSRLGAFDAHASATSSSSTAGSIPGAREARCFANQRSVHVSGHVATAVRIAASARA